MKKRIFSLFTALALCLTLLPGTALAEGDPGVSISGTPLVSGKQYVAGELSVEEKTEATPEDTPYLDYTDGVLTVHGQMDLKSCDFRIDGAVTFTGGGGSCLETGSIYFNSNTLTLSGSMDFKPESLSGNYSASQAVSKLTTTDNYSGDIAIQGTSTYVLLDVQSSASISIGGAVDCSTDPLPEGPMTLKSAGDISTDMLVYHTVTIAGKNVSLKSSQPAFWGDSLTIQAEQDVTIESSDSHAIRSKISTTVVTAVVIAGGNVTISSYDIPVYSEPPGGSLTVENAKSVSIQGKTNAANDDAARLLTVPVTFENCGSVTVTDTGNGEILKEGVPVTSDKPWTATAGGKTVTIPSGTWTNGGDAPTGDPYFLSNVSGPTCYKAGEGWMFYEPGDDDTGTPAKLTLDGASYEEKINIPGDSVQLELKGENAVTDLTASDMTLTGNGSFQGILYTTAFTNRSTATLNALVGVEIPNNHYYSNTVYGKYNTSDISGFYVTEKSPCTIAEGAVLTVDTENGILFDGLGSLTNNGTIINNSTIKISLDQDTADADISAFIKELKLTDTGTVTVEKMVSGSGPVTETYTHSGVKLLEPAGDRDGKLDLRDAAPTEEENAESWAKYGYKWEVLETDPDDDSTITKAKLTLAPGFNAETVVLPDATVEIETQGESTIGTLTPPELTPGNAPADKTNLTLSGLGPLNIQNHVEISGGQGNRLTVAEYARVQVTGGVTVGSSGAVDGLVTVNGTLIAAGGGRTALSSGNVVVSGSGTLKVSGDTGVSLAGKSSSDFHGALTIQPGGRLEADCTGNAVVVTTPSSSVTFDGYEAGDILVFPSGYLPQDRQPRFNEAKTSLSIPGGRAFTISSDNVPTPPQPSHRHKWAEDWTTSATHHWHNCTASGCPVTADSEKNGYGQHAYDGGWDADCNVCGYTRSLSSSEPSGGSDDRDDRDGGDSAAGSYAVTVERTGHGNIRSSHARASAGSTVTLTAIPDSGYALDTLSVTDSRGDAVKLTEKSGKHTFIMPGRAVTVRAVFAPLADGGACDGGAACPSRAFTDLKSGAWYHEAVDFILRNGLMNGYGNGGSGSLFGPEDRLSRAQFAQILYNKEGRPARAGSAPFTDVAPDAWCAPAIAWAAERGIAGGYGNGTFGPDDPITREQLAVMLWRYAGSPAAPGGELSFMDAEQIGSHAREAICWAVENGVMSGKSGGVLDPKGFATRAQTAQMLKNFLENG